MDLTGGPQPKRPIAFASAPPKRPCASGFPRSRGASAWPRPSGRRRNARPWDAELRPGRPSSHPSSRAPESPSCPVPSRSSFLRRTPRSPSPRPVVPLPSAIRLASRSPPRCDVPAASASPCRMTCRLGACDAPRMSCLHARGSRDEVRCDASQHAPERWVERARGPFPARWMLRRGFLRGSTMRAEGQRLVRPQSRGLRAGSDVSQNTVLPYSHCDAR